MTNQKKGDVLLDGIIGGVDIKREDEGEWFEHSSLDSDRDGPNEIDGFQHVILNGDGEGLKRICVRSRYTKDYESAVEKMQSKAMRMPRGIRRERYLRDALASANAEHVIVDWDWTRASGEEIPYSSEMAKKVMTDPFFRRHRNFIEGAILKLQGDIELAVEEDEGN